MRDHDAPGSAWQGVWLAGVGAMRDVRSRASDAVREAERALDAEIGAVLHRIGIATREDVAELERGVEALSARLESPRRRRRAAGKKTPPKAPARSRVRRRSARKTSG